MLYKFAKMVYFFLYTYEIYVRQFVHPRVKTGKKRRVAKIEHENFALGNVFFLSQRAIYTGIFATLPRSQ